jgi:hypothetical protein
MDPLMTPRRVMWVGLNPSTADESQLDPTLRRIRGFSLAWGFTSFVMTNLFAFRSTQPEVMFAAGGSAVGPENDLWLVQTARSCELVVAAWGAGQLHGQFLVRAGRVRSMFNDLNLPLSCVGTTRDGFPRHPLYVAARTSLQPYNSAL